MKQSQERPGKFQLATRDNEPLHAQNDRVEQTHTYEVAGGWQAEDPRLFIACYGRDEAEARRALERARTRAREIAARARARPNEPSSDSAP